MERRPSPSDPAPFANIAYSRSILGFYHIWLSALAPRSELAGAPSHTLPESSPPQSPAIASPMLCPTGPIPRRNFLGLGIAAGLSAAAAPAGAALSATTLARRRAKNVLVVFEQG